MHILSLCTASEENTLPADTACCFKHRKNNCSRFEAIGQIKKRLLSIFYAGSVYVISRNGRNSGEKFFMKRLIAE
ncbi:hypothetical protein CWS02_17655 [Enterobacter sp. EA-1]|nr:hypothetical protein CWS02_17655 [Enterobacter sp. EA-1]